MLKPHGAGMVLDGNENLESSISVMVEKQDGTHRKRGELRVALAAEGMPVHMWYWGLGRMSPLTRGTCRVITSRRASSQGRRLKGLHGVVGS